VAVWANAYRSGDYVGRYLWCAEDEDPWDRPGMLPRVLAPNRMEMCIGPGGHLRYWDASAPEVAATLDALIDAFVPGGAPDAPRDGARSARPPFTDPTFVESLE